MQRSLFSLFLLSFLFLTGSRPAAAATPPAPTDTIVMRLPNKATLTLMVRDAAQLRELKKYHLDSLTTRLASYIQQAEAAAQTAQTDQTTMEFFPAQDQPGQNLPEQIRITTNKKKPNSSRMDVFLNKNFGVEVERDNRSTTYSAGSKKAAADSIKNKDRGDKHTVELRVDIGVTAFVNRQAGTGVPGLSTWGSFYTNLGLDYVQPLLYRRRSKLALTFGPEVSFYKFELRGSNRWVERDGRTFAELAPDNMQIDKAHLYMSTLNLPLMLQFKMRNSRDKQTLSAGIGGFGGYRLKSTLTTEYKLAGSDYKYEDKQSGPLHINNWQYGLQAEVGFHALTVFARYHLNELFQDGQSPQTNVMTFGLSVLGF